MVGIDVPSNKILIAGNPVSREFKATVSTVKPGYLCKQVTSNIEITIGGAATGTNDLGLGVAGWEGAHESYKPATRATAYADDAFIPLIMVGSGALIMAACEGVLALGAALTGQAAAGPLVTGTIGTNHIYAILLNARTAAAEGLTPVILL